MSKGWISASDELPDRYDAVLVACRKERHPRVAYCDEAAEWRDWTLADSLCVTHWRPLPRIPGR